MRHFTGMLCLLLIAGVALAQNAPPAPAPSAQPNQPAAQASPTPTTAAPAPSAPVAPPTASPAATTSAAPSAVPPVTTKPPVPAPAAKSAAPVQLQAPVTPIVVTVAVLVLALALGVLWLRRACRAAEQRGEQRAQEFRAAEDPARAKFVRGVTSLDIRPRDAVAVFADHRASLGFALEPSPGECEAAIRAETDVEKRRFRSTFAVAAVAATALAVGVLAALA